MTATLKLTVPAWVAPNTPFVVSWTLTENYVMAYTDDGLTLLPLPAGSGIPAPTVSQGSWTHPGLAASGVITMQETSKVNVSGRVSVTVKAAPIESASGATLNSTAGSIVDALGNVWTLVQSASRGLQFACDGRIDAPTGNVVTGLYWGPTGGARKLYQVNTLKNWYVNNGAIGNWSQIAGDPRAPVVAQPTPAGGTFTMANGQLLKSGAPFLLKGVAVLPDGNPPTAAQIASVLPGCNALNWAGGQLGSGGYTNFNPPDKWYPQIDAYLAAGLVVMISDYTPGAPNVRQGADAQGAFAWYATIAARYKDNPNVMFTTQNEPLDPDNGRSITLYHQGVYNAVRNIAGSGAIIWMEPSDSQHYPTYIGPLDPEVYTSMRGVGWNIHQYPWTFGGLGAGSGQATYDAEVQQAIVNYQAFTRSADGVMPCIMGEGGNASDGNHADDVLINGVWATVQGYLNLLRTTPPCYSGVFPWIWNYANEGTYGADMIVTGSPTGAITSPMGTQIAARYAR